MCGIAGIAGGASPDRDTLERMALAMAHRGPDGQATWSDAECGLAFRRLAIIDLDERSMQPLHHDSLHLVFNGEIYDYRERREELLGLGHTFVTEGDGEVFLHAWAQWGEAALERVNGMFALAVWDDRDRSLTLAADAFGEKPLFWSEEGGGRVAFASDLQALREAVPRLGAPAPDVLAPYLGLGLMPPVEQSFFAGVHRLPGAHLLRWRDGRAAVRRWWTPGLVDVPTGHDAQALALRDLLTDSIRLRLRSDVPVGTSLSGGVDSSAIVALSATIGGDHRRHAFTAAFDGFERDEWRYAETVAASAGVVEHHAVRPQVTDLLDDLDDLVACQQEPFASSSIYAQYRVMRAANEAGVTVLLDGQGADELFAGYPALAGWATRAQGPLAAAAALARGETAAARAIGVERLPRVAREFRPAWPH